MKIKNILFVFVLLSGLVLGQEFNPELSMSSGNVLFRSKLYDEAIKEYDKILKAGYESPELFYNMGNAYFRTDKLGYAVYCYEKAAKLAPGDEDIAFNLELARSRTQDKIAVIPKFFVAKWWDMLVAAFTVTGWSWIVIFLLAALLGLVLHYLYGTRLKQIVFYSAVSGFFILLLAISLLISRIVTETGSEYGILLESSFVVKYSPDAESNDAFVIHEGIKFVVEDELQGWYKIKIADGKVGWIPKSSAGII